ncbi:MAG: DUF6443 domain-containing protein [Urechidicola sp.]|nr:DUF6443 domain-containing protein [Urechidicola sp.]
MKIVKIISILSFIILIQLNVQSQVDWTINDSFEITGNSLLNLKNEGETSYAISKHSIPSQQIGWVEISNIGTMVKPPNGTIPVYEPTFGDLEIGLVDKCNSYFYGFGIARKFDKFGNEIYTVSLSGIGGLSSFNLSNPLTSSTTFRVEKITYFKGGLKLAFKIDGITVEEVFLDDTDDLHIKVETKQEDFTLNYSTSGFVETNSIPTFIYPSSPDYDENFIKKTVYTFPTKVSVASSCLNQNIETIVYYDGLGRAKQSIEIAAGGQREDIITQMQYDEFGRTKKEYLPYADITLNSRMHQNALSSQADFYFTPKYENTSNAYSEKSYENSPLNRVFEIAAQGEDWKLANNHTVKFDYQTNYFGEVIGFFVKYDGGDFENPSLLFSSDYGDNTLVKSIIKDENWKTTDGLKRTKEEFTNNLGQLILKREYDDDSQQLNTYYVYDDFGNLTYVLPPLFQPTDPIDNVELEKLCYQYKYDSRNRIIEKRTPGKGWEYIVYNKANQPVLTQDQNLKAQNKWIVVKYDALGRAVYTGIKEGDYSRVYLQNLVDNASVGTYTPYETRTTNYTTIDGVNRYYSSTAFPNNIQQLLTVNYYDDYGSGTTIVPFNPANGSATWNGMTAVANVKGLPTITHTRVLETTEWITTAIYYDEKGRPWETYTKDGFLNVEEWSLSELDFIGNTLLSETSHTKDGGEGSLWAPKLYNGNIGMVQWKTANDYIKRGSNFTFDALNRLTASNTKIGTTLNTQSGRYQLYNVSYDKNGNIETLKRNGHTNINSNGVVTSYGQMDNLIYTYEGDQLKKVRDIGNGIYGFKDGANIPEEYTYDANGNMLRDYNKNIISDITYNYLNLPTEVKFGNDDNNKISYTYSANGTKLRKITKINNVSTTTDYASSFIYKNGNLEFFSHAEGYVKPINTIDYEYVYQYKDHLGNVRLSYADSDESGIIDGASEIIEENNYYPFGLKHKGYNEAIVSTNIAQKFKYNGKEFEEALGYNMYEMDMRSYDPSIARWTSIDPVTHHSMSTYAAFDNNPIFWADPSGADADPFWDSRGSGDPFGGAMFADGNGVARNAGLSTNGLDVDFSDKRINYEELLLDDVAKLAEVFALFNEIINAMNDYLIYSANNEALIFIENELDKNEMKYLYDNYYIEEAGQGSLDISHISKKAKAMGVKYVLMGTVYLNAENELTGVTPYSYSDTEIQLEYNPRMTSIKSYNSGNGKMNIFGIGTQAYSSHKYSVNFNHGATLKLMFTTNEGRDRYLEISRRVRGILIEKYRNFFKK